ncbi:MAG: histidine--tRNA ligase [Candidatus Omnitrophota bacterium]
MKYQAVKGMEDILWPDIQLWQDLERKARADLESYGYMEIRTPVLEDTAIFVRGIGETTDIVTKEMYTFKDRKERSLTLRPEGTAPIVRAYIEHSMDRISQVLRLYYIGPMFRSERPQKGRSRQFHQIGVEIFGSKSHFADAEVISQLNNMLKLFKLTDFVINLNSLGCKKDKENFGESLKKFLEGKKDRLCQDCKERAGKNALRVLDCKNESCRQIVKESPDISKSLCPGCENHFKKLKDLLEKMNIKFNESANLVRGLDYYTGPVFEITHTALGAQDAIGAGGRYDNLVKDLGGPDAGAIGYALGIERIIMALKKEPAIAKKVVYIATLGDAAKIYGIQAAGKIRKEFPDLVVFTDITEASLKSQMRTADKSNAGVVLILGENELAQHKVVLKDMRETEEQKKQILIDKNSIVMELKKRLC